MNSTKAALTEIGTGKVSVTIDDKILLFSPGDHNELQKAVIDNFLPRFGMGAKILYIGDTSKRILLLDTSTLEKIGFFEIGHDELPDIVAYSAEKNLLFLIEAVHSSGPMSEIRVSTLKRKLTHCKANVVFFTAFLSKKDFRRWSVDIAWETEVWIAESPEHLIHFNGYKFLEMHK